MPCRIAKLVLLVVLAFVGSVPADSNLKQPATQNQIELAKSPYEVRLRKLHLVRPDLIPYPIYFEVYC
jgi:hypothetical protein